MWSLIKTGIGFVGGSSSIYALLAGLVIAGGAMWHYYDKYVTVPVETAKQSAYQCNTELTNKTKEFDANLTSTKSQLAKCIEDIGTYSLESFEKGRIQGIKDAEANKTVRSTDVDAICFQPYF